MRLLYWAVIGFALLVPASGASADSPKRILLLGQKADTHPPESHEYMAGVRIVARLLERFPNLKVQVVQADSPWRDGPELLAQADGVFLYLTEGARWLSEDPARLQAFEKLASRGGGLVALHWAMGTKIAEPVPAYVKLFGACHGGPDRKVKIADVGVKIFDRKHPVTQGLHDFRVPDEWYFKLKLVPLPQRIDHLLTAELEGRNETVAWAFSRSDGGRSCGFTGLHYHVNWKNENYRRFVVQAILWSVQQAIPPGGVNVDLPEDAYRLAR